ncbi:protein NEDD1-like [Cucurbita pepo subsp. pepo]|uniref:protein NEDD1-like n=1 Tax=Cucurbita pepo subsp. pepo TaxID=3664 RepID=UPI000C9D6DBF|nr:protein NEDD1-like [Cucurbita pepo subsp. pepo]
MTSGDPSMALLAASAGDTVKLFDVSAYSNDLGDPCTLSYTPSPGYQVNSVKWNHTNLVVASAGDDKKISLWRKNGQSMGTIPIAGSDGGDNIEESIFSISFSNKVSRYMCTGGSGHVVRIWDLQRKRCIKWLRGHTNTITGAMYNCKDEHLASISLSGDLLLHNLASGARAAELKDPNEQVLRVLDYSRISRHLLVTAGDDGTVHLWDTTGRNPKVSWQKQHSAPTAGISFSPSNDKTLASVGLDKKLYTYDSGSRRPSSFIAYEAPFSSMAFRDDGLILAAGTSNGRVVFYDVRGKPEPYIVLRAYSSSEAVTSISWQRLKPVIVNEGNCTADVALLGGAIEDSILMPDPLPSVTTSTVALSTTTSSSRNPGHSGLTFEASLTETSSTISTAEETPHRSHLRPGGSLTRLHAPRSNYNFKDDMEVFSPLVDVQPITPSLDKLWDDQNGLKKDHPFDKKPLPLLFPSSSRRFSSIEDGPSDHPIFNWKSSSSKQDDSRSSSAQLGSTPAPTLNSKNEDSSITPPEAWGGEKLSDKFAQLRQPATLPSRFGMLASSSNSQTSSSMISGLQDPSSSISQSSITSLTNLNFSYPNMRTKDVISQEVSLSIPEHFSTTAASLSLGTRGTIGLSNQDSPRTTTMTLPRRFSTYAERLSTTSSFSDGLPVGVGSPKTKKMGSETREEVLNNLSKFDTLSVTESGILPAMNGGPLQQQKALQTDAQQGNSFTLQLFQRTLEETLDSFQRSIHDDMRNLHLEILRQFHMQEMEMSSVTSSMLKNQAELIKEVKSLRKENQQLRNLLGS